MGDCSAVVAPLRVKVATEEWEFREIHRLNHATFADEIPQHETEPSGFLIDAFHDENTYFIAIRGERVVGMLAVRGNRPFSLDRKVQDLDSHLPPGYRFCEVRLLAIAKSQRLGRVLQRLLASLWRYSLKERFDAAVISGTTGQLKMYRRLGFVPFGSLVGAPGAQFQPMFVTRERAARRFAMLSGDTARTGATERVNLLPGPVDVRPAVRRALRGQPQSHRSAAFAADLSAAQRRLCQLTGAARAVILVGSGTLANETIAAQLSVTAGRGLILTNGEFGERLVDQASRWGLTYEVLGWPWGSALDMQAVEQRLSCSPVPAWLWFVHLETSTGVLNDLAGLTAFCSRAGVRLCVDAISAAGMVPVRLREAWFGSAVSGKGLGAYPGLSIVFHNHPIESAARVPRYLDLALYARPDAVPFTHSSNLVRALKSAVEDVDWERRYFAVARNSAWLRARLRHRGFDIVSAETNAAPGVVTIALPPGIDSRRLDEELSNEGYLLASASEYLHRRNWIQISLMSQPSRQQLRGVVETLDRLCAVQQATKGGL
jgi:aspartate aminotransferase-like enzyme